MKLEILLLLSVLVTLVVCKDYYQILGVKRDATKTDIKKAFRKLALKYHPDRNDRKDAEIVFREMVEAYEVLINDAKREQYNQGNTNFDFNTASEDFDYEEFYKKFDKAKADHLKSHYTAHQRAVNRAKKMAQKMSDDSFSGFDDSFFDDLFDDEEGVEKSGGTGTRPKSTHREYVNAEGKKCQEIITKDGNSVSTQHICVERTKLDKMRESLESTGNINPEIDHEDL